MKEKLGRISAQMESVGERSTAKAATRRKMQAVESYSRGLREPAVPAFAQSKRGFYTKGM